MAAPLNKEKYVNALLYFVSECGNEKLGITKLNVLFYYLDFISFRDRERNVTGETYMHLPKGPFASSLEEGIIQSAQRDKSLSRKEDTSEKYGKQDRFQSLKPYDPAVFDEYEKSLLAYLCLTFKDWTTDEMGAQTHSEAPWVFSRPSQALDYKKADDIEFFKEHTALV